MTTSANKYELNIVILNSCVDVIVIYLFSKWMFFIKDKLAQRKTNNGSLVCLNTATASLFYMQRTLYRPTNTIYKALKAYLKAKWEMLINASYNDLSAE